MSERDALRVEPGTRLLHVGPHKTGSTALQGAFDAARDDLLAQDVRYAGALRHEAAAARWVTDRLMAHQDPASAQARWEAVVAEMRGSSQQRVVFSSEFLSDARRRSVRRIVTDLGAERLRVVVTLRPLARILASQWQQYVQRGLVVPYEDWLAQTLDGRPPTPTFWVRHRHDELVRRWAADVGAQNVTVIVLDPSDHDLMPRTFERMLGLRAGTLVLDEDFENRSLNLAEAEAVRHFNLAFRDAGLPTTLHDRLVTPRSLERVKQRRPGADEPRIVTPDWALERVREISAEIVDGIRASGAQVVGDLDALAVVGEEPPAAGQVAVPPEAAGLLALAMAESGRAVGSGTTLGAPAPRTGDRVRRAASTAGRRVRALPGRLRAGRVRGGDDG